MEYSPMCYRPFCGLIPFSRSPFTAYLNNDLEYIFILSYCYLDFPHAEERKDEKCISYQILIGRLKRKRPL